MEASIYYILITLVFMELRKPCYCNSIRKTLIAADTDEDEMSRKIVPKSIFITPLFSRCPRGYTLNHDGDCLRLVRLNPENKLDFILSRLNDFFSDNNNIDRQRIKDKSPKSNSINCTNASTSQSTTESPVSTTGSMTQRNYKRKEDLQHFPTKLQIPVNTKRPRNVKRKLRRTTTTKRP